MSRVAHRSSSGALNFICSLWFIYPCGDRPLPRLSGKIILNVTCITFAFLTAVDDTFMVEHPSHLGRNSVSMCEVLRTFRKILLSSSSGLNNLRALLELLGPEVEGIKIGKIFSNSSLVSTNTATSIFMEDGNNTSCPKS